MRYIQDLKNSLLHPQKFYSKVKLSNFKYALTLLITSYCVAWVLEYFVYMFKSNRVITPFVPILWMITSLPVMMIGLLIVILFQFALVKLLRGDGTLRNSLQAFSYTSPVLIFISLPYINMAAVIYQLYLLFLALKRFHNLPSSRSALVIVILAGFGAILGLLFEVFKFK